MDLDQAIDEIHSAQPPMLRHLADVYADHQEPMGLIAHPHNAPDYSWMIEDLGNILLRYAEIHCGSPIKVQILTP